jgi:integrase
VSPRRGWRERVEPGLYRVHRLACPSSGDRRERRRCGCPFQIAVPGARPGATRLVTVAGSIGEARAERNRLRAEGRPVIDAPIEAGTLDEFAGVYFRTRSATLAPSTIALRDEAYRLRISPDLGGLDLQEITRQRVEVWFAATLAASGRHATRKAVDALRSILRLAVEWGRLAENPASRLRLPKPAPGEGRAVERVLDADQLTVLIAGTNRPRVATMLRAAGELGLRRGEVIGLRWGDIDFPARRIRVERSVWQTHDKEAGTQRMVGPPKNGRRRRVAMSEGLSKALADWFVKAVVEGGAAADGYVWPARDGGPMDAGTPGQALARVLERVGLVDDDGEPLVTLHGLRHTAASIMLAHGVPLIVVSRQLGHAHPNVTAQVYAHLLSDAQLDAAAAAFDAPQSADTLRETLREREPEPR